MSESVDVSGFSVLLYTKNRGVHRLLPMDFRLREPGIVEHRPTILKFDESKPPVRQRSMRQVHKFQHSTSHPSLRVGAISE